MLTPISLLLSSFSKACKDDGKCTWAGDSQIPPPGEPPGVAPAKSKDITTKGARSYEEEMGIGGRDREREREGRIERERERLLGLQLASDNALPVVR